MSRRRRHARWFLLATLVAAACGDGSPAEPPPGDPVAASVSISTDRHDIELGDSILLVLEVRDATGAALTGRRVTWTSSAPGVLDVTGTGVVHARAAGDATITALVDGVEGSVSLAALAWNVSDDLLVVDSTVMQLVSDSAAQAAGLLRFTVLQGAPAAPSVGTVVVGTQNGGFLRRVTASSLSGSTVVLETAPAALADVVENGRFETTIDLLFDPGASGQLGAQAGLPAAPGAPARVVWGAGEFRHVAAGMTLSAAGFDLSGVEICALLEDASDGAAECPEQLTKLEITTGRLDFTPDLEMEAEFDGFALDHFRGVATGALDLELALTVAAEGTLGELEHDVTFFTFTRPFFMQLGPVPVVGYVEMALTGAVTVKATAKASFTAGMQATSSVELGAEYDGDDWTDVSSNDGSFSPAPPTVGDSTLSAAIEVEAKVSMKPRLQIIFYGLVGPFAQVEPFGSATLTLGTTACGLTGASGIDAAVGFTIPFLDDDVMDFDKEWSPLVEGPGSNWDCPLGLIDVNTITNGDDTDTDGYQVLVDGHGEGTLGPTAQLLVPLVQVGERTVTLGGVAPNCTVQDGVTRTVNVLTGGTHPVSYTIDCSGLVGDIEVTTTTTGAAPDEDGYTLSIDGGSSQPIGVNATVSLTGVAEGTHSVELTGIAPNCTVSGSNPASVSVAAGARAAIGFSVSCSASELVVRTRTDGPPSNAALWTVTLDDADPRSIEANGEVTYTTTPEVHTVELTGLPDNCTVSGANPTTVTVSTGAPTEHEFAVSCRGGSLTVEVSTETSDTTITTFTAMANGESKDININGSVSFSSVPEGTVAVTLVVPENCTVDGLNPRDATVPGSVAFDVTCQQPLECPVEVPATSILDEIDVAYTEDGSYDSEIIAATFGHLAGRSSTTAPADLNGPIANIYLEWHDYLALIPVDSSDIGRSVRLRADVAGSMTLDWTDVDKASADVHYNTGSVSDQHMSRNDGVPGTFEVSDTAQYTFLVGDWGRFDGALYLNVGRDFDDHTTSATASLRLVRLIDVVDYNTGEPIAIRLVCAASGTEYPR